MNAEDDAYKPQIGAWIIHKAQATRGRRDRDVPLCQASSSRSQQDINAKITSDKTRVTCERCQEIQEQSV